MKYYDTTRKPIPFNYNTALTELIFTHTLYVSLAKIGVGEENRQTGV